MEKTNESKDNQTSGNEKILTAYFSRSGNTRVIANQIHKIVGGDIFEIETVQPYPNDYDAAVKQARHESDSNYKPKLKSRVKNIESYEMVFVGYPNWWGTIPMPLVTFFSEYNFPGKTIIPFCTHEGSGLGRSVSDIRRLCPQSTILEGLAVRGSNAKKAQNDVSERLRKINIVKQES